MTTRHRSPDLATQRRVARLSAVQALHMVLHDANTAPDLAEFRQHWFAQTDPDSEDRYATPDEDLFTRLVQGAATDREALVQELNRCLAPKWRLSRLEMTMQALLVVGAWEVRTARAAHDSDLLKIALKDYTELADSFFGTQEAGLANAVLDRAWGEPDAGQEDPSSQSDASQSASEPTAQNSVNIAQTRHRLTQSRLKDVSAQRTRELKAEAWGRNRNSNAAKADSLFKNEN